MSDLISKAKTIEMMRKHQPLEYGNDTFGMALNVMWRCMVNVVQDVPTVNAVPVIRCKECIYWDKKYDKCDRNELAYGSRQDVSEDDFCSWAERKEE